MKNKLKWILCIGFVLVIGFIFVNALMDYSISHALSGWLADCLGIENKYHPTDIKNGYFYLRKLAHVAEYGALGFLVMLMNRYRACRNKCVTLWFPMFFVLAVGVLDEFFQSFSNRTSSVNDIILDFIGGILGMFLAALLHRMIKRKNKSHTGGDA